VADVVAQPLGVVFSTALEDATDVVNEVASDDSITQLIHRGILQPSRQEIEAIT
jgi:hypothetical protein